MLLLTLSLLFIKSICSFQWNNWKYHSSPGYQHRNNAAIALKVKNINEDKIPVVVVIGGGAAGMFSAIQCAQVISESDFPVIMLMFVSSIFQVHF